MQDAEGTNDGSYSVMDNSLSKLTEVMLLVGQNPVGLALVVGCILHTIDCLWLSA